MLQLLGIALVILALGICLDMVWNGGEAISNIFSKNTIDATPYQVRMEQINIIKEELDELHDDLTYDNDENEIASIKAKITTREDILKKLLSE